MLGIGFHSLLDGVIYSVTFEVSVFTGVLATAGLILHELPEGIVTYLLLERSGLGRARSVTYAFLAAAVSTPLGALVSYPFVDRLDGPVLGMLLATSGGALIYVGASHLLPEVEKAARRYSVLSLAAGVLVAGLIVMANG